MAVCCWPRLRPLHGANRADDQPLLDMAGLSQGRPQRLAQLPCPRPKGHALEPWAAYWELKARLNDASAQEAAGFFAALGGTYQEDRLRNDWLQLLGQRAIGRSLPKLPRPVPHAGRPRGALLRPADRDIKGTAGQRGDGVRNLWYSQRDADDGCTHVAAELHGGHASSRAGCVA